MDDGHRKDSTEEFLSATFGMFLSCECIHERRSGMVRHERASRVWDESNGEGVAGGTTNAWLRPHARDTPGTSGYGGTNAMWKSRRSPGCEAVGRSWMVVQGSNL